MKTSAKWFMAAALFASSTFPALTQEAQNTDQAAATSRTYSSGLDAEVYVVAKAGELKRFDDLPSKPSGIPLGVIADESAPQLNYNVFTKDASFSSYYGENILGVLWKGYLKITMPGVHIISASDFRDSWRDYCLNKVWINGNDALTIRSTSKNSNANFTDQNAFDLTPGMYEIKVWKVCTDDGGDVIDRSTLERSRLTLLMKSPKQPKIEPIDKSLLAR